MYRWTLDKLGQVGCSLSKVLNMDATTTTIYDYPFCMEHVLNEGQLG